jgi:hypothetical protein
VNQTEQDQVIGRLVRERAEAIRTKTAARAELEEFTKALTDVATVLRGSTSQREQVELVFSNPVLAKYCDMTKLRALIDSETEARTSVQRIDSQLKAYGLE